VDCYYHYHYYHYYHYPPDFDYEGYLTSHCLCIDLSYYYYYHYYHYYY